MLPMNKDKFIMNNIYIKLFFSISLPLMLLSSADAQDKQSESDKLVYAYELLGPLQDKACIPQKIRIGIERAELLMLDNNLKGFSDGADSNPKLFFGGVCQDQTGSVIYGLDDSSLLTAIIIKLNYSDQNELQEQVSLFKSEFGPPTISVVEVQRNMKLDAHVWELDSSKLVLSYSIDRSFLLIRIVPADSSLKSVINISDE